MNGQITEVKQLNAKANCKMGEHLGSIHFVCFQLAMIGRNIRQICQIYEILLISWNFGKTQMLFSLVTQYTFTFLQIDRMFLP